MQVILKNKFITKLSFEVFWRTWVRVKEAANSSPSASTKQRLKTCSGIHGRCRVWRWGERSATWLGQKVFFGTRCRGMSAVVLIDCGSRQVWIQIQYLLVLRGVFAVCMYLRLSASEWSCRLKVLTCFAMFCCLSGSLCISTTVSCRRRTKCEPRTTTSQMKLQRCCDPWPLKTFDLQIVTHLFSVHCPLFFLVFSWCGFWMLLGLS